MCFVGGSLSEARCDFGKIYGADKTLNVLPRFPCIQWQTLKGTVANLGTSKIRGGWLQGSQGPSKMGFVEAGCDFGKIHGVDKTLNVLPPSPCIQWQTLKGEGAVANLGTSKIRGGWLLGSQGPSIIRNWTGC